MKVENVVGISEIIEFATDNQDVENELGIKVDEVSITDLITLIFYYGILDCDQRIYRYEKKELENDIKRIKALSSPTNFDLNDLNAYSILLMFLNKNNVDEILMTCE